MQLLAMLGVGDAVALVAVGLPGLREQDQRRRVSRLQREREIEQDERIDVELRPAHDVDQDPDPHDDRLCYEKGRRSEETGEALRPRAEPVAAENRIEMRMRQMKTSRAIQFGCLLFHAHEPLPGRLREAAGRSGRSRLASRPIAPTIQESE